MVPRALLEVLSKIFLIARMPVREGQQLHDFVYLPSLGQRA